MDGEVDSLLIEGGFLFVGVHNNKREGIIKTFNMTTGAAADLTGFQVWTVKHPCSSCWTSMQPIQCQLAAGSKISRQTSQFAMRNSNRMRRTHCAGLCCAPATDVL